MASNATGQATGPSSGNVRQPAASSPGAFSAVAMSNATKERGKWLNMLVYGPHGAGKTTLLGSSTDVEGMTDVLLISAEGGAIVFEDNERVENVEGIAMIKIDRIEQFQKAYEWLKFHCDARDRNDEDALRNLQNTIGLEHPDGEDSLYRFHTVIIDSLSELEAFNLAKILNLDALGLDAGDDMEVAGFPQFRKNMHIMQRIVRQFRDLPIHCMVTCAQSYSQDERKAFHYGPKLTGQLTGIIQGFFDIVGWLVPNNADVDPKTGVARRRLFVQPQTAPKADAKCRLASYKADHFEDPVMDDIMRQTGFLKKK